MPPVLLVLAVLAAAPPRNPFARALNLRGCRVRFPPTIVSCYECDMLRDEAKVMFRKLTQAGVPASGKVVLGMPHAGDMFAPEGHRATEDTLNAIVSFANSLSPV